MFIIIVSMVGCNVRELSFDREYPNTESLEITREKRQAEIDAILNATSFPYLVKSSIKPNPLFVRVGSYTVALEIPLQYCWSETVEECAHLKPINIYEDERFFNQYSFAVRITKLNVKPKEQIKFELSQISIEVPLPDRVELYMLKRDGTIEQYKLNSMNSLTYSFNAPSEVGSTIFIIKSIFEERVGGIAFHALEITNN